MKKQKRVESFKKYVDRVLTELRVRFYVKEYDWSLSFEKEDSDNERGSTCASISTDVRYLSYKVRIYPILERTYKQKNYRKVFDTLVHEMCHIYTEPLYLFAIDAVTNTNKDHLETVREQQTQRIAGCIQELIPRKVWLPR